MADIMFMSIATMCLSVIAWSFGDGVSAIKDIARSLRKIAKDKDNG